MQAGVDDRNKHYNIKYKMNLTFLFLFFFQNNYNGYTIWTLSSSKWREVPTSKSKAGWKTSLWKTTVQV